MRKLFTFAFVLGIAACSTAAAQFTNGIFILNEDWYGHNPSSVNFYSYEGDSIVYNAYQSVNPGMTLGNTAQFAELGPEHIYFCSKQNYNTTGGRLIVANAKTLDNEASIEQFGADTRAFLSIDDTKAYISTSQGIYIFNKATNTVDGVIEGTAANQVGNMTLLNEKALAVAQGTGIYVINTATDKLEKTIEINQATTAFTINGQPYAAVNDASWGAPGASNTEQFIKLDPETYEIAETLTVPMASQNTWFAWKNANPAIDEQNEILYYAPYEGCTFISKYDIKASEFTQEFITFSDGQSMYGNVVGFDAITNYVVAMTFETYGSKDYYLNIYDTTGHQVKGMRLNENYWFPAMLLFAHEHQIPTAVHDVKTVDNVQYVNLQGQVSDEPFQGMNIKVTTYIDGTRSTSKIMIK